MKQVLYLITLADVFLEKGMAVCVSQYVIGKHMHRCPKKFYNYASATASLAQIVLSLFLISHQLSGSCSYTKNSAYADVHDCATIFFYL